MSYIIFCYFFQSDHCIPIIVLFTEIISRRWWIYIPTCIIIFRVWQTNKRIIWITCRSNTYYKIICIQYTKLISYNCSHFAGVFIYLLEVLNGFCNHSVPSRVFNTRHTRFPISVSIILKRSCHISLFL